MSTKIEAGQAGFKLETYEARAAKAQADAELAAAETVQKMIDAGFTEQEIQAVIAV